MSTDNHFPSSIHHLWRLLLIVFFLIAMFVFLPTLVVQASTWTVCASGCNYTTIALAIQDASTLNGDTIQILDAVHTENTVYITKDLVIEGLGTYLTIWQAGASASAGNNYLMHSDFNKKVTLRNMTLRNGGSQNIGAYYGTISFLGPATLENLLVTKNYTNLTGTVQGGAISTQEPMTVTNCIISENIASSNNFANGGGIFSNSEGLLIIKNTSIINNIVMGNSKTTGPGVRADGGGLKTLNPTRIENSTISGNLAMGGDVASGIGGNANGGGISWDLYIIPFTITNSTISGNAAIAGDGETSGAATGGGLYIYMGTLNFVTVYSNTVAGNLPKGGGLYSAGSSSNKPNIQNSIFAHNTGTTNANGLELYGRINSQDYNLIEHSMGITMTGTTTHNIYGFGPRLDPLADNGGDTQTHAPRPDSAVINAIPSGTNGCILGSTFDQTGKARPTNGACEIGSFEVPWMLYLPVVMR
jgi:hypothetical protein